MKQQLFEQQHGAAWERFERQLQALEHPRRQDATESLADFASQYRLICHLLALAQERHYSPYLIDHLNDLALRGHQHFYQRKGQVWHNIVQFVVWGFPAAIRRESRFVWLGVLLFFVPAFVMGTLTYFNPNMIYTVYPHEAVQQMVDMYDPANNKEMSDERGSSQDLQMFGFYIRNNVGIGFQTFASGILLGIGAVFHLLFNGLVIGAVAGYLTELGHVETFWPFVIGHGAFELTAIAIAGGAGLKLGYGLLAPGRLTRKQSLIQAARGAMPLVYGIFFFLIIAAFIEAFWSSSSVLPITVKLVAGGLFWLLVILYLSLGGAVDIGKITAQVRPRNPNEATDLGIVMARRWYGSLLLLGVLPTLPLALLLFFVFRDQLWWAVLILWWIKPLWETLQLHFVAEALFNPDVQWRDILRRTSALVRHQFFAKLIAQRLSLSRSFNMPVGELEQLRGAQRRRRLDTLHRDASASRIWLTLLGNTVESMLVLAVFATTWLLMPVKLEVDFELSDFLGSPLLFPTITWAAYGAMMLVSPFYVCSGFMLYINRRTWLEAWDIELSFRQLAARIAQTGKAALLIAGLCLLPLIMQSPDAIASPATTFTPEQSQQDIVEILEGDDFNEMETKTGLRWRKDLTESESDNADDSLLKRWWQRVETWLQESTALQTLLDWLAALPSLLEALLWGLFIAIVAYLLYRFRHVIVPGWKGPARDRGRAKPSQLFGLALDQHSLPDDVLSTARRHWQSGRQREALSLLYRAALSHLVHERHLPLEASHTESECVAVCRNNSDRLSAEYFQQLTGHWITLAYAHRLPSDAHFVQLCDGWPAFASRSDDA